MSPFTRSPVSPFCGKNSAVFRGLHVSTHFLARAGTCSVDVFCHGTVALGGFQ